METQMWRGGLRFALVGDGGPSVVMGGLRQSLLLSAMTSDMNQLQVQSSWNPHIDMATLWSWQL